MITTIAPDIGASALRIDGVAKASGAQVYPSDFVIEGMLWLRVLRAAHPHARILAIDTSAAEQIPGVVRVITAADIPGDNRVGIFVPDTPVLCEDRARCVGDAVAVVAAESDEAAIRARDLIKVDYEVLPVVSDPHAAMLPDSPRLQPEGNLLTEMHLGHGDIAAAFANADLVFENEYQTGRQAHTYLETEAGVAFYDEEGRLTIRFGGQYPQRDQEQIAHVLGLPKEEVRVITPMVGGAFGGKDDFTVQCYLALVTHLTKCPCRIMLDREESFLAGPKRHPFYTYYKTACTADGLWVAAEVKLVADTGAYGSWGPKVLTVAVEECLGPYHIPNVKVDAYCVLTNNLVSGAFRGFGAPQAVFGLEQQVDMMARATGLDPIEFRRRNALETGQKAPLGFVFNLKSSYRQVLEAAEQGPIYSRRDELVKLPAAEGRWKKRGVGLAGAWMGIGYGAGVLDAAAAWVELNEAGWYRLHVGGTDMGQGNSSAFVQMVAHELNCRMEDIELVLGDTLGPDSGACDAVRQITIVGMAAVKAAHDLRHKILAEVARELKCNEGDLALEGRSVVVKPTGERRSLAGLGQLLGKGYASMPETEAVTPGIPLSVYTYGAQVALVEVDLLTGEVEVLKLHSAIDAGKVINLLGVEGQSEGGLAQGLGYALLEDCLVSQGKVLNPRLSTYIIPSINDVPSEMTTTVIEDHEPLGPYGAKGIAELVLVPTAPAILNAVYNAVGERFTRIPLTPETVLRRLTDEN